MLKVEDSDERKEVQAAEVEEEISHSTALKALLYIFGALILGILALFIVDKVNDYAQIQKAKSKMEKIQQKLQHNNPFPVYTAETIEFELAQLRTEVNNSLVVKEINALLEQLQKYPVKVETGTYIYSWSNASLFKTEVDTVIVPYFERQKYKIKKVTQPVNVIELRAFGLYSKHPQWSKEDCLKIANRKIWTGMTKEQLLAAWGRPKAVDKTYHINSVMEQWAYGTLGPYVYLENDYVTSWQE
ncbi:MAG: hypothetical protein FJ041_02815 [Candidatus Cloacimonetes bacterium]|nr:hypothetical protein [Candidatus Cloacimonadota bacterium]